MSHGRNKGALVISESMLTAIGIVITLILLISFGYFFFQTQLAGAEEASWEAIGREVAGYVDRAGAEAGSVAIEYQPPKGAEFDLKIDYKRVTVRPQGKTDKQASIPFSTLTNLEDPVTLSNPDQLCIYKDQATSTIAVTPGTCRCEPGDGICSPGCLIEETPDPACNSPGKDYVCDPRVSAAGDGICDPDCYRNANDGVDETLDCNKGDKIKREVGSVKVVKEDGTCDKDTAGEKNGICDLDCHSNQEDELYDPDCTLDGDNDQIEDENDSICDPDGFKDLDDDGQIEAKNGVCDLDCAAMESNCDPDCGPSKDEGCGNCAEQGEKVPEDGARCCQPSDGVGTSQKLVRCPGDHICRSASNPLACEGNDICEISPLMDRDTSGSDIAQWPMNSSPFHWENTLLEENLNQGDDCAGVLSSMSDPGQNCADRVNKGSYDTAPCGYDDNHNPTCPVSGVIEVCQRDIENYLDRRSWDISQILAGLTAQAPRGFAFNHNRYDPTNAQNCACTTQKASKTIKANENYQKGVGQCCTSSNCGCADCEVVPECAGVGFCGDHSVAILSVLRTLGVPANHTWSVYSVSDNVHHGWVAYKCGSSSSGAANVDWKGCNGDEWIAIDPTSHETIELRNADSASLGGLCSSMRLWFNDHGQYQDQYQIECGSTTYDSSDCQINNGQVECSASTSGCQINYPFRNSESCSSSGCPLHLMPMDPNSFCN